MATPNWLIYANQNATRDWPLDPRLIEAMSFLPELGLSMEVFSGGQPATGSDRTGSHRHDYGAAGDVFFRRGDQRLNWANPQDLPVFQEIVRRAKAAGVTGFGAGEGYMQPGSMHLGFGSPAVWGAGGSGRNAPQWLRAAYYGGDGNLPLPNQYALASAAAPDGPKGQESYPTPAPALPAPYEVADRPIANPVGDLPPPPVAVASAEDPAKTRDEAIDEGVQGVAGLFGSAKGGFKRSTPAQALPAARVDAPDVRQAMMAQAEMQRQQLALAMQRLNSGRLFV